MSPTGAAILWLRNKPSGSIKTREDLKTKFLSKYCPPARTTKKMEEINNFQQEPDDTIYQAWERFKELLMKCPQHYLIEMQVVILYYNGLDVPTRQILDSKEVLKPSDDCCNSSTTQQFLEEKSQGDEKVMLPKMGVNNVKDPITPKNVHSMKKVNPLKKPIILSLVHPSNKEGNIEQQLWDSTKEIMQILPNSYGASHIDNSIPRKEKDPGSFTLPCYINNVCFDNALADLGASVSVMPLSTYLNLGLGELAHTKLTVELADRTVKYPREIAKNVLAGIGKFVFPVDFIILDMLEDVKVPLILERLFLSTAHAKIDVFKRKITLRVGDEKIIFKSMKPASSLIKRVYMLGLRERMELDLEARLMGETLVKFYNSIMKDKFEYKGKNVVGDFMNVPIFVRKFSIVTHFAVVENIDGYRDQDMGDVIFGEPFSSSCVEAKGFDGVLVLSTMVMIT
ncbi:hypothetical protein Tco_0474084 [Tanacetum coccineum]